MKRLFEFFSAFLCINSVTPVLMYYIYDENPNVGFVGGLDNGVGAFVAGYNTPSKKQYASYGFQKYANEQVVDSHFKVMKSPSRYSQPPKMEKSVPRVKEHAVTESPNSWRQNTVQEKKTGHAPQQKHPKERNMPQAMVSKNPKDVYITDSRITENQQQKVAKTVSNMPPVRPKAVNADYTSPMKAQRAWSQNELFEAKPSFVQMNVRKTQISQDPQVLRLNNNRQLTSASLHGGQASHRQRIPTSMMMDKTLHKTNGHNERNLQTMSRVLDDMTQQLQERHQKSEYRKRDIKKSLDFYGKPKRNPVSDTMRKYIGKDKTVIKEGKDRMTSKTEVVRIGSREESLETSDAPYALFYRMNPENLDHQEAYISMRSLEARGGHDNSSKEKRSDKFYVKKATARRPMSINNALSLSNKMRNFSSLRNQ